MKSDYQKNRYVVEGSAARNLSHAAEESYEQSMNDWLEERERRQQKRRNKEQRRRRLEREQANQMTLGTFLFLVGLVGITLYVCISYLQVRGQLTNISKEIASLQSEIIDLKDENQIALEQVDSTVDLSYVYKVATKELGMVHPSKSQIIEYQKTKSDFVKQYDSIPEVEEKSIWKKIINMLKK